MRRKTVIVNDKMQRGYRYVLTAPPGRNFDPEFHSELTPAEMLRLGVFCGKYMTDCRMEFPHGWFRSAKLAKQKRNCSLNYFGVDASQPLSVWRKKGWIYPTTRAAGFSGIAATTPDAAFPRKTPGKSSAGRRSVATCGKCSAIASPAM